MSKIYTAAVILLLGIIVPTMAVSLRESPGSHLVMKHDYWFNKDHPNLKGDDERWYYCDYKCLAL